MKNTCIFNLIYSHIIIDNVPYVYDKYILIICIIFRSYFGVRDMFSRSIIQPIRSIPILMRSKILYIFGWTWTLALSLLIVGNGFPPIKPTLLIFFAMIFVVSSVYIFNDIVDVDMDRENKIKKDRPIASGQVKKSDAEKIVYLLGFVGLAISWLVNISSFIFILIFYILFYSYSDPTIRLKTRFLAKDLTLFIAAPLLCLAANYAISNEFSILAFSSSILSAFYILTTGPIISESTDIVEDKKYGVKSISTMFNWETKIRFLILGVLLQLILVPFVQLQYGSNLLLPIVSIVMLLLTLRLTTPLFKEYNVNYVLKAKKIQAIYFFISPITFVLLSSGFPLFLI